MDIKRMLDLAGVKLTESKQTIVSESLSSDVATKLDAFYEAGLEATGDFTDSKQKIIYSCEGVMNSYSELMTAISESGDDIPGDMQEAIDDQKGVVKEIIDILTAGRVEELDVELMNANGDLEDMLGKYLEESKQVNEDDEYEDIAAQEMMAELLRRSLEDAMTRCLDLMVYCDGSKGDIVTQVKEYINNAQRQLDRLDV